MIYYPRLGPDNPDFYDTPRILRTRGGSSILAPNSYSPMLQKPDPRTLHSAHIPLTHDVISGHKLISAQSRATPPTRADNEGPRRFHNHGEIGSQTQRQGGFNNLC